MPACATLTGVSYETSEQHKEGKHKQATKARLERERHKNSIAARNPFGSDPTLRNIMNGIAAEIDVNAYEAKRDIIQNMEGKCVDTYSVDTYIPLSSRTSLKIDGETVTVD